MEKNGITAGGNWILDKNKIINDFPHQDGLCNILEESVSNGGAPYNLLKNLSRMGAEFPLLGVGMLGNDTEGDLILEDCKKHKIGTDFLWRNNQLGTSYTDVMTSKASGRRTFFHYRGANALLDVDHFPLDQLNCKIFHLGYLLLLDKLDEVTDNNLTNAALVLQGLQRRNIETSVDIVSENSDRFSKVVPASLPYVDYLFVNEYEASRITEIPTEKEGKIDKQAMVKTAWALLEFGVNKYIFLHTPDGVLALGKGQDAIFQGKVQVPPDQISGTAGAGDAFASGVLFGLHENWNLRDALKLGVCVAASSLKNPSCSESVLPVNQALELGETFGYYNF